MDFKSFVINKKPLLVDDKLHIEAGEMFRLHDEWMDTATLKYYGGNGYDGIPDNGDYLVKYDGENGEVEKQFMSLRQARALYDRLQVGKALWDIRFAPELLECHTLQTPDLTDDLPF